MKNPPLALVKFTCHAAVGTVGVLFITALLTFNAIEIVHKFVPRINPKLPNVLLTEVPGFPLQILFGLVLGYAMWKLTKHTAAFWAWVAPVAVWVIVFVRFVFSQSGNGGVGQLIIASLDHFLWTGCSLKMRCIDQVIYTLPSVAAVFYSLGAWIAGYMSGAQLSTSRAQPSDLTNSRLSDPLDGRT